MQQLYTYGYIIYTRLAAAINDSKTQSDNRKRRAYSLLKHVGVTTVYTHRQSDQSSIVNAGWAGKNPSTV